MQRTWYCYYDGECHLCQGMVARFGDSIRRFGGQPASLQDSPLAKVLSREQLLSAMRVWTGVRLLSGAQAIVWILGRVWFLRPVPLIGKLPLIRPLLDYGYAVLARNRHCFNGACTLPRRN